MCVYRQPPNPMRLLAKSIRSRIPTLVVNSKCIKPRCQVSDLLDTRKKLHIPGTSSTIQPETNNWDSCNIVYVLMCYKCDSGDYIGETSNRLRFRLNNLKKSIRENSRGFPVAVLFNQPDHSLKNWRCVILRGVVNTTADRLICEQMFIHNLKIHSNGVNQDIIISIAAWIISPVLTTFNFYVSQQHRSLTSKTWLGFFLFTITATTPLRKDTWVYESIGRLLGLKRHYYALCLLVLSMDNPIRGNVHMLHRHALWYIYIHSI